MAKKNKKKENGRFKSLIKKLCGIFLISAALILYVSLIGYNPKDPCINQENDLIPTNFLGALGANVADLVLCGFGIALPIFALSFLVWGYALIRYNTLFAFKIRLFAFVVGVLSLSSAINLVYPNTVANYPLGGKMAQLVAGFLQSQIAKLNFPYSTEMLISVLFVISFMSLNLVLGITLKKWYMLIKFILSKFWSLIATFLRAVVYLFYLAKGKKGKKIIVKKEPKLKQVLQEKKSEPKTVASTKKSAVQKAPADGYMYPDINLLSRPKDKGGNEISQKELDAIALKLEEVLQEFGVNGKIVKVRPGPVVTLYELEPAPGTKTARVISLADDIARSMSAVSVRIAVVPGSNTIGIEMPNAKRETVWLKDLLSDPQFKETKNTLNIVLGKDIGGKNTYADLAKMPHLLVAGTTGSGKSVGVNSMILSLLYKMKPEECKLIMIDPKMLEFSMYNGIPHLLTPVITDPAKAVVGLKWAVREMEDRYRKMAQLNVRNITGYNQKLRELRESGETVTRTIQIGFDPETGKPIYEQQEIDTTELPYIVIVVDEMADLMLVAGKEVEAAIQRLAQMARAAGLHLIMSTQRPSVDVITGTIKANFPSRISFQVTSKIDSRTILGEQGAEQLLGMGDMLYMPAGLRPLRVHGSFVKDSEVEAVVDFLKSQRAPEYIEEVTAGELNTKDNGSVFDNTSMGSGSDNDLYMQAVNIVRNDKKASTSYIQRKLRIGYNRAAALIDRMEEEGIVGPADHVGRREVL
ncbi:MAG: DNA translocase FtsK 4TM domain-containing protein [Alphaproteobacteria bacterium]|nr:DNA translocase FtsK 4TM domain-containing protein [Alphaproteobacteria bacterium]